MDVFPIPALQKMGQKPAQQLMIDFAELPVAEELEKLLQVGQVAPLGMVRYVLFLFEVPEKVEDLLYAWRVL